MISGVFFSLNAALVLSFVASDYQIGLKCVYCVYVETNI